MKCRSCGAPIFWATTLQNKKMPIDAEPVEDGTILISMRQYGAYALIQSPQQIVHLRKQAEATGQPHRLFKSHFATCPNAGDWRNPS